MREITERATKYVLDGEMKSALDATNSLAQEIERDPHFQSLAHALLALGEGESLQGIARLKRARSILLDDACLKAGATLEERNHLRAWHRQLETCLESFARSRANRVLLKPPEIEQDRLHYFLWLATRTAVGHDKAVEILLPGCYRSLRNKLRRIREGSAAGISMLDDLPYQIATFIRFFSQERLLHGGIVNGSVSYRDVEEAIDAYHKSEKGIAEIETRDRYVRQIAETLGIRERKREFSTASDYNYPSFDHEARNSLGFDASRRITTEEDLDEDGHSLGILVWPESDGDDYEHKYESARYVNFGVWRGVSGPRAPAYWTTRERRVVTPNELRRLIRLLDKFIKTPAQARGALLIWLALTTGLPIKRLLNLRLVRNVEELESLMELAAETVEESPIYLCIEGEVLLATPSHDLDAGLRLIPGSVYRPRTSFIPMTLGRRGRRLARVALSDRIGRDSVSPFVFSHPHRPTQAITLDGLSGLLRRVSLEAPLIPDQLTWSRLSRSLRPYSVEAGFTPLLSGISTGRPTRPVRTILHYVAIDTCRFYADHAHAVRYIEQFVDDPSSQFYPEYVDLDTRVADVARGCIGAAYVPRPGLVAQAWKAIGESNISAVNSDQAHQVNLCTLRAAFALMIAAGVRQQELTDLRCSDLDLDSGLLRIRGKGNAYFRESREVPLPVIAVDALRTYLSRTAGVVRSDVADALFVAADQDQRLEDLRRVSIDDLVVRLGLAEQVPFSTRTLRHALRTELHDRGASYDGVNEAFGHTVLAGTIMHQLSGSCLGRSQNLFREDAQRAASALLNV